jgi:hypothetical protein
MRPHGNKDPDHGMQAMLVSLLFVVSVMTTSQFKRNAMK